MSEKQVILGWQLAEALIAAGVITIEEHVRRLVIDCPVDAPVVIHVERYGDERLLEVAPALRGVEVVDRAAGSADQESGRA